MDSLVVERKKMTIRDAIKQAGIKNGCRIMFRTYGPFMGENGTRFYDSLIGYCVYSNGELIPEDHDSYSIDAKIEKYVAEECEGQEYLIVWEDNTAMDLPIAEPWFSMIRSGEKKEEYREIKPYWETRFRKAFHFVKNTNIPSEIFPFNAQWVRFRNGYGNTRPSILALVNLKRGTGRPEWGAEEGKEYYVLNIKEVIDEKEKDV